MNVSWTVKNQGAASAGGTWYDQVVLSTDQFFSQDDVNLLQPYHTGPLAVNGTYSMNGQLITIPYNQAAGTYYLLLRTDAYTGLAESDETNNEWPTPIQITVQTPDLIPTAFSSNVTSIVSGQQMNVSWTVKNQGNGTAFNQWYDQVVLSTDQFFSQDDVKLVQAVHSGPLTANATYSANNQLVTIPYSQAAGTCYLLMRTDAFSSLFENGSDANNEWGSPIQITVQTPDLVPTAFSASTMTIVSEQQLNVSWTVKNQGDGTAFNQWYDQVVLSTDEFFSANDVTLAQPVHSGPLAPNATYSATNQQVTIPYNQPAGSYFLLLRTDAYSSLFENGNDGNNEWSMAIAITVNAPRSSCRPISSSARTT